MSQLRRFVCEGCLRRKAERSLLPDGWCGYGCSARTRGGVGHWCATCRGDGTMAKEAQTTFVAAINNAAARGVLGRLRRKPRPLTGAPK